MKRFLALSALIALMAGPALAQEQPASADPIGDVLSGLAAQQGMDDDAAESATATAPSRSEETATPDGDGDSEDPSDGGSPPQAAPAPGGSSPAVSAPFTPRPPVATLPNLDRPVMIDELYRSPEAPPTPVEKAYESRIRGGLNAAQGLQGPLDGGWIVRGPDGRTLYSLQLVDKGTGALSLEGAWRSLKPGQTQVGLVDTIERTTTGGVYIRFTPRGAREPSILQLSPSSGGWSGTLWEAGDTRTVTVRRN